MNPLNSNNQRNFQLPKQPPQLNLQQFFSTLQSQCSTFVQNLCQHPLFKPNASSLQGHTKHTPDAGFPSLNSMFLSTKQKPVWARISDASMKMDFTRQSGAALSTDAIEERLAGIPVYALSNSNEEFVLVSGASTGKSLGLMCFKKEDAEVLLGEMKIMDPVMRKEDSKVVPVALNKVFNLKVDGVAFRLIPESAQIKNALREREKAGFSDDGFSGVPVFQSRSLVLRSQSKSYRPFFFRKEDLEMSLLRASQQQNKLNPALREGDIQVAVFEEIIKGMKASTSSTWNDVVFIPPGFDVSTDPNQR